MNIKKNIVISGCGIKSLSHLTRENEAAIKEADKVLYLVNEPILCHWIQNYSKDYESLEPLYFSEELRANGYTKIVERVLLAMEEVDNTALVVYGHPLVLSSSIQLLLKLIDRDLFNITVLPGISSLDCLFADLEIDPARGFYSIEANELIDQDKILDQSNHLVLWQIGIINNICSSSKKDDKSNILLLKHKLLKTYAPMHDCILYEASLYPHIPFKRLDIKILNIDEVPLSRITTLYIPPLIK